MVSDRERAILDDLDQALLICKKCNSTLADYRAGEKCTARLDERCEGFTWCETVLQNSLKQ